MKSSTISGGMTDSLDIRPLRQKILVRKCITGTPEEHDGHKYFLLDGIVITDQRADFQHWCEVISVSDDCRYYTKDHIGQFIWLPEMKLDKMYPVPGTEADWIVRESMIDDKEFPALVAQGD